MPSLLGVQTCARSEEHTSELQSHDNLVCRLLLEKKITTPHLPVSWEKIRPAHGPLPAARDGAGVARGGRQERCGGVLECLMPRERCFFFNDAATTEVYTLSLPGALRI